MYKRKHDCGQNPPNFIQTTHVCGSRCVFSVKPKRMRAKNCTFNQLEMANFTTSLRAFSSNIVSSKRQPANTTIIQQTLIIYLPRKLCKYNIFLMVHTRTHTSYVYIFVRNIKRSRRSPF